MSGSSLRELGLDLLADANWSRALAVFAESVRRQPADHRSRMLAARCLDRLGERDRAVTVLKVCGEVLLKRDFLLSAMAACRQALGLSKADPRILETLSRIHSRAAKAIAGKASVPPPLPPEKADGVTVDADLMALSGLELVEAAMAVLGKMDGQGAADPTTRPPLPLFAELDRDAFIGLVSLMDYQELKEGETICVEGEAGDAIHVVVAGKAEVTRRITANKPLAFLAGGSILGEISMLTGTAPTSTVRCVADTEVFEITREHLNQLARLHPSVTKALASFAQQRMARNLVSTSPVFAPVPEAERATLFAKFDFRAVKPGEKVITEGEPVSGVFMVLAGELIAQKEDPSGGSISLGILREGDIAGEIALMKGLRATATVSATRKTAAAYLERNAFFEILKQYPAVQEFLEGLSDRRLKLIGDSMRPAEVMDADELVVE